MGLFLAVAAVLLGLRILWSILTSLRHAQNARQRQCGPVPKYPSDWLGISTLREVMRADHAKMVPPTFRGRFETMRKQENRLVTTFEQVQLGRKSIVTFDPKNVQAVLATQFKDFELGEPRRNALHSLLGSGIFTADGEAWSRSRGLLRPQFTRDQISDLDLEERHVQAAMRAIPVDQSTGWSPATDIQSIFFRLTIDSATEFLFGESVDSQTAVVNGDVSDDKFPYYFDRGQWYAAQRGRLEHFYWMANNKESRFMDSQVRSYVDRFVANALERRQNGDMEKSATDSQQPYNFLNGLATITQDPVELRSQLLNILLAGRDTTASLLSWCILLLARHPDIFQKLRATVLETFGTYDAPHDITFGSLKSCRYLHQVINEVLRLYPIVPGNRRVATRDTTLPRGGGPDGESPVYVRKGQSVNYHVFAMQRRTDLWGPNADGFDPERWVDRKVNWDYLPFNGGPRICIGQQFALTETGYVLVRLLQRFDRIEDVNPQQEVRYGLTLTLAPADPVTVRLHEAPATA
ncbi:putative cytochrome P450 family protein [Aspergillus steynii IBT 23096]|uniref:Putative cytochrome P450 family protein n=1 Tax=Aspergillus steynii IBT 23096 TaxID=1392250 RepID=A0A2I2G5H6_9EURO|nr:putative cytochrome P450 family protein [Aspergillus steynii IBT 23096]PLB48130.1 putative cytochrome P450 family protein [Aspergillus steynii IBT 23096]